MIKSLFNRINRIKWFLIALVVRKIVKTQNNKVFCWEFYFRKCGGNPKYIADYILSQDKGYIVYWAISKDVNTNSLNPKYSLVKHTSFSFLIALYSSRYIITNYRNDPMESFFVKKKDQKYIMTWHGSTPLKKVEKDAIERLDEKYVKVAKLDSQNCDLMLSNCLFFTNLIKQSFWYNGEILEKGIPCNDILFNTGQRINAIKKVKTFYHIANNDMIVLYAPTFRNNDNTIDPYRINWNLIIPALEITFKRRVTVMVRLHPNIAGMVDTSPLVNYPQTFDATFYPDMQELLCSMDLFITDYSSTMFDSMLMDKPCILYALDKDKYDRGFYFSLDSLPFPLATNEIDFLSKIKDFDIDEYNSKSNIFKKQVLGISEDGHASESFFNWMLKN